MQPEATVMAGVAEVLAKTFTELKQDMDKIIVENTAASCPTVITQTAQSPVAQYDLPALQLHGRTYSESPGYDDCALKNPIMMLPEAISETITLSSISIGAATQAEARAAALSSNMDLERRAAEFSCEVSTTAGVAECPNNLTSVPQTAEGTCRKLTEESVQEGAGDAEVTVSAAAGSAGQLSMQEKPLAMSQLSYKDLLEKALGRFDPRLEQQFQASMHKNSPEHRMAAARLTANQGHSKFPDSTQQKRLPAGKVKSPASPGSLRIFKQGSGSAQKLLGRQGAEQQAASRVSDSASGSSTGNKLSCASRRCVSAPREKAAEATHVRRMSPGAPAGAAVNSPARSKSNPRGTVGTGGSPSVSLGYIDRLYTLGVEKQQRRAQAQDKRSVSPVRLSEQDWNRVTTRLFNDARNKEERMRIRREKEDFARDEAMHITTGAAWSDRMHSIRRSTGAAASTGARGTDSAFDGRQQALLDRRAEWAKQRRGSHELSPEDKKECRFHPEINPSSRRMIENRSVEDMLKWGVHRKLHLDKLKEDHDNQKLAEDSESCHFMPEISDLSRQLALQSYAAAPDPRRPWTSSPVHMTAPIIRPLSPPRSSSPNSRPAQAAGISVTQSVHPLRHSINGPHLYANGSVVGNSGLLTAAHHGPAYSFPGEQGNQRLWTTAAAAAGVSQSVDGSVLKKAQVQPQQLQAEELPVGVVMGIPVDVLPAAASAGLREDAVIIQMPNSAVGSRKPLLGPVAPGDGVAFISLGPIKTSVAPAAAGNTEVDSRQRQVVSPVQAQLQLGLEQGLGSGDWAHVATAAAVRGDDSAANTPVRRTLASAVPSRLVAARAFRDDSAGGSFPVKRASSGGAWFSPVTSTQKVSIAAKAKTGASAADKLQPTLSDATRAALELSQQLGLTEPSAGYAAAAAAAANRQQAVPAYYVALDKSENAFRGSSKNYNQKYGNSTASKLDAEELDQVYGSLPEWRMDSLAASKTLAMQEWQQRQQQAAAPLQTAGSLQKFSTAQLLNARNRSSFGGLVPATSISAQTAATLAGSAVVQSQQSLQISHDAAAQVLPVCDSDTETSMTASLGLDSVQQKADCFLNHTQSVPFELQASPRSWLYLSTSSDGGGASASEARKLLAALEQAEEGSFEPTHVLEALASAQHKQHESGVRAKAVAVQVLRSACSASGTVSPSSNAVQGLHSPVASSPCLSESRGSSCVATPSGSSHNLMTQLQRSVAAAAVSSSKLSTCSKAQLDVSTVHTGEGAAVISPSQQQQQVKLSAAAAGATSWSVETTTATAGAAATGHQAADDEAATGRPEMLRLGGGDADADGGVNDGEVWGLLFDEELTPQARAQRMMKIFSKTMSKRNIQLDSLQQTLVELSKAVSASSSASNLATEPVTTLHETPAPTQECTPAESDVVLTSEQDEALGASENIQQLLLRMSAGVEVAAVSSTAVLEQQQQQGSVDSHAEVADE